MGRRPHSEVLSAGPVGGVVSRYTAWKREVRDFVVDETGSCRHRIRQEKILGVHVFGCRSDGAALLPAGDWRSMLDCQTVERYVVGFEGEGAFKVVAPRAVQCIGESKDQI